MNKILKDAPQEWIARDIPPSQGILILTQVGFTQSTEVQQESKSKNLAEASGASLVHRSFRSQLSHLLYQSQKSLVKY